MPLRLTLSGAARALCTRPRHADQTFRYSPARHVPAGAREAFRMFFPVPNFKGFDFFPHGTRINFMRYKGACIALSLVLMAASLVAIAIDGFNYGVDFKGGTLIEVQAKSGRADVQELRDKLAGLGLGNVQIQICSARQTYSSASRRSRAGKPNNRRRCIWSSMRSAMDLSAARGGGRACRVERAACYRRHRGRRLAGRDRPVRVVPFRLAVRTRRHRGIGARCDPRCRHLRRVSA